MKTAEFQNKVKTIINNDSRYPEDSYEFINDAVIYTVEKKKKEEKCHVSGKELLDGVMEFAIFNFGPMAYAVLSEWGIDNGESVGNIVFNLVKCKILSTNENDTIDDFKNYKDFKTLLTTPFETGRNGYTGLLPIIA
jgi:uncharacterized repeat protein (TIGR04138 family)